VPKKQNVAVCHSFGQTNVSSADAQNTSM